MFSACNAAWPRRPARKELSVIKIRSSLPPAAYQRLDANPTIHMQMRFLGSTGYQAKVYKFNNRKDDTVLSKDSIIRRAGISTGFLIVLIGASVVHLRLKNQAPDHFGEPRIVP